jgi:tetratricopeptide (TPR) repeat protein
VIQLASVQLEQGNAARALATLEQGGGALLEEPSYWFHRAWALYDLKRTQESITAARKGLALQPNGAWTLFILALSQERLEKFADAETSLLSALRLAPENPAFLTRYALLVAKAGQWEKAERLQAEAERIAPNHSGVKENRTKLAFILGDTHRAVAGAQAMLAEDPEDTFAQYVTGQVALEQGAYAEGEKRLMTAARQNPTDRVVTSAARHSRFLRHPLLIPLYPIEKFGAIPLWIGFIVVAYGLRALGQVQLATIVSVIYLLYCVYSWVVPRALKWYLERQRKG